MRFLVVSATSAEAAHVPPGLDLLVTGLGKTAAAAATARALATQTYDLVVNIGTAGALHDHREGLFEPGGVLNHDLSAEVIRSLNDAGHVTRRPIVVVNWTNEEGARFSPPMVASGRTISSTPTPSIMTTSR